MTATSTDQPTMLVIPAYGPAYPLPLEHGSYDYYEKVWFTASRGLGGRIGLPNSAVELVLHHDTTPSRHLNPTADRLIATLTGTDQTVTGLVVVTARRDGEFAPVPQEVCDLAEAVPHLQALEHTRTALRRGEPTPQMLAIGDPIIRARAMLATRTSHDLDHSPSPYQVRRQATEVITDLLHLVSVAAGPRDAGAVAETVSEVITTVLDDGRAAMTAVDPAKILFDSPTPAFIEETGWVMALLLAQAQYDHSHDRASHGLNLLRETAVDYCIVAGEPDDRPEILEFADRLAALLTETETTVGPDKVWDVLCQAIARSAPSDLDASLPQ